MNEGPFGGGVASSPVIDLRFNDRLSFPRRGAYDPATALWAGRLAERRQCVTCTRTTRRSTGTGEGKAAYHRLGYAALYFKFALCELRDRPHVRADLSLQGGAHHGSDHTHLVGDESGLLDHRLEVVIDAERGQLFGVAA